MRNYVGQLNYNILTSNGSIWNFYHLHLNIQNDKCGEVYAFPIAIVKYNYMHN